MTFIARLLGGLLAVALTVTAVSWVGQATVWNADYVKQTFRDQRFYDRSAIVLPSILVGSAATGDQAYLIKQLVSPGLVQQYVEQAITKLESYYRDGGAAPTLDLTPIRNQFASLGLTPPPLLARITDKPQHLSNPALDTVAGSAAHQSALLKWLGPVAALVLAGLIILIARRRRWSVLMGAGFTAAVMTALAAGLVLLLPQLATGGLTTSVWGNLVEPVRAVADAVAKDASHQLLWWAVGFAAGGVLMGLIGLVFAARTKFSRTPKEPPIAA